MSRQRTAHGYLVIEDRRPHSWSSNGDAVISKVYVNKPDATLLPAGARVIPVKITLPIGFFDPEPVVIDVPADYGQPVGEVTP